MSTWQKLSESVASKKGADFKPEPEMTLAEAEQVLAAEVSRLQASPNRSERCKAKQIGEIIGNHRSGKIGDSLFFGQAKAIKKEIKQ